MSRKKPKKSQREPRLGPALHALARAGGWVGLVAVAGTLALAAPALERRAGDLRADPLSADFAWPALSEASRGDLAGSAPNTWMPRGERERLTRLVLGGLSLDPADREGLAAARDRLARTGWFERDLTLRRLPGGVVEVRGTWRTPAAVVESAGAAHVVSSGARRLPLTYEPGEAGPLRFVRDVWGAPPTVGEVWAGGDVRAGIGLLEYLEGSAAWPRVAGVSAARFTRDETLAVVTASGATVVWGSAPPAVPAGQVDHAARLGRLEALVTDPSWEAAGRPRVELHLPRPIINESAPRD